MESRGDDTMRCPECGSALPEAGASCPSCASPSGTATVSPGEMLGQTGIPKETRPDDRPTRTEAVPASLPTPELPPGSTLGTRYRVVALAGKGGMGEVYRAEDLKLGQTVAVKDPAHAHALAQAPEAFQEAPAEASHQLESRPW